MQTACGGSSGGRGTSTAARTEEGERGITVERNGPDGTGNGNEADRDCAAVFRRMQKHTEMHLE